MDQSDVKAMGWNFTFPTVVTVLIALYTFVYRGGLTGEQERSDVGEVLGVWAIPFVSFWVIGLYRDFVETEGKELLLSLPYQHLTLGMWRVGRAIVVYILLVYVATFLVMLSSQEAIPLQVYLLIGVSVAFFGSFSFVVILLVKNTAISYAVVGIYALFTYLSRGGFTGWLYPFHWAFPKPGVETGSIVWILLIADIVLLVFGQWLFSKREFLVR